MAAEVRIIFKGENQAKAVIDEVKSGLSGVGGEAEKAGKSTDSFFKGMLQSAGGFIAANALGKITEGIGGVARAMIGGNAEFEGYNAQFTVLLKSSDAAKQRLKELADFGASTPFELPEVVRADKILQGFGLHSEEAAEKFKFSGEEIRRIAGDTASGAGASFEEMSLLLGKFSTGATGEAIARMMELGITSRDELKKMGLEFTKAGELTSPLPQSMETVLRLMKEKYGGLMDVQSKTFAGMTSNLQDWIGGTLRTIGQPLFEILKDKLADLLEFLNQPSTQQAIVGFAKGLGAAAGILLDVAGVIIDNAKPALIALTVATGVYAAVSLPTMITAVGAATTALGAKATAMMASLGPYALIAAAVFGVVKAYDSWNEKIEVGIQKLVESRDWWTSSTGALDAYAASSKEVQAVLGSKADALENLRTVQQAELEDLTRRMSLGEVSKAEFESEMVAINARSEAIRTSGQELQRHTQLIQEGISDAEAMDGANLQMVEGYQAVAKQVTLTTEQLDKYYETLAKNRDAVTQALDGVVEAEATFQEDRETARTEHEERLNKLVAERTAARANGATATELQGIQDQINAEIAGYDASEQEAAVAYAEQQAQQREHLGIMLLQYLDTKSQMVTGDEDYVRAYRGRIDELKGAVVEQYGVQMDASAIATGQMLSDFDAYAAGGKKSLDQVKQAMADNEEGAVDLRQKYKDLEAKYTAEVIAEFKKQGKYDPDELADALERIPARVYSEVYVKTTYAEGGGSRSGVTEEANGTRVPGRAGTRARGGLIRRGRLAQVGDNPDGSPNDTTEIIVPEDDGVVLPADVSREVMAAIDEARGGGGGLASGGGPSRRTGGGRSSGGGGSAGIAAESGSGGGGPLIGSITVQVTISNPVVDTAERLQEMAQAIAQQTGLEVGEKVVADMMTAIRALSQEGFQ